MRTPHLFLFTGALFASALSASASSAVGMTPDPMGSAWVRNQPGTAFAEWDLFSTYTIVDDAPDSLFNITNALLDQAGALAGGATDQGAGAYESFANGFSGSAGNKLLYSGNRALAFTVTGDLTFTLKGFTLQIKRVLSQAGTAAPFYVRLNGITPDGSVTFAGNGDTETSSGGLYSTTTYYWGNSLASSTATTFNLEFGTNATSSTRIALDTITIDAGSVAAVPEPSAVALLLGSATLLGFRRRSRIA